MQLLNNATVTGNGRNWMGGRGVVTIEGTFGGATATLEYKSPRGTWMAVDTTAAALTANGVFGFELPGGEIRISLAGGAPTGMYAWAYKSGLP